ncbi:hypothetical protein GCM10025762_37400 [Haloechinothrix salitolerans]
MLLGSEGNVPVERTAMLIHSLLGVEASTGFVARAAERLADKLDATGFDEAMKAALRGEDALCGDESPVKRAGQRHRRRHRPTGGRCAARGDAAQP